MEIYYFFLAGIFGYILAEIMLYFTKDTGTALLILLLLFLFFILVAFFISKYYTTKNNPKIMFGVFSHITDDKLMNRYEGLEFIAINSCPHNINKDIGNFIDKYKNNIKFLTLSAINACNFDPHINNLDKTFVMVTEILNISCQKHQFRSIEDTSNLNQLINKYNINTIVVKNFAQNNEIEYDVMIKSIFNDEIQVLKNDQDNDQGKPHLFIYDVIWNNYTQCYIVQCSLSFVIYYSPEYKNQLDPFSQTNHVQTSTVN